MEDLSGFKTTISTGAQFRVCPLPPFWIGCACSLVKGMTPSEGLDLLTAVPFFRCDIALCRCSKLYQLTKRSTQ